MSHEGNDALKLDDQLCFLIYSLSNKMARFYRVLLEERGLTFPQYLTLLALWEKAPCTVNAVGRALGLESNTLTPVLKRLEALGYLTRIRDTRDERRVLIHPTLQGNPFRATAHKVRGNLVRRTGLSKTALTELRKRWAA